MSRVVLPSGITLPRECERRPKPHGRRWSPTMGLGAVINPDGTVAWQEDEWVENGLHDAGEQKIQQVFYSESANVTKFLALLNDAVIAETDGTMAAVTETQVAGANGYTRPQVLSTDWVDDGLIAGDYRFSALEKTFGAATVAWTLTTAALCTTVTGAGLLLATLALSATTTIAIGQFFKYILRSTLS